MNWERFSMGPDVIVPYWRQYLNFHTAKMRFRDIDKDSKKCCDTALVLWNIFDCGALTLQHVLCPNYVSGLLFV